MDFSVENGYIKKALVEFKKDLLSNDEAKLKVVLGENLYDDPFVQEILSDLLFAEQNPNVFESYEYVSFAVLEEILDAYFEAMYDDSLHNLVKTDSFQHEGCDLIDTILGEFVSLEYLAESNCVN
jgi:ATP-dependent exoDNAse (exonuclease V) beta subunit